MDRLDTHFTLPTFDIEACLGNQAHWLPQCLDWIRSDWYDWEGPVEAIRIYYDGSYYPQLDSAGSAVGNRNRISWVTQHNKRRSSKYNSTISAIVLYSQHSIQGELDGFKARGATVPLKRETEHMGL